MRLGTIPSPATQSHPGGLLGGSWDLVSKGSLKARTARGTKGQRHRSWWDAKTRSQKNKIKQEQELDKAKKIASEGIIDIGDEEEKPEEDKEPEEDNDQDLVETAAKKRREDDPDDKDGKGLLKGIYRV